MSGPFSALSFLKKISSELLCAYFKRFEEIDLSLFSKGTLKSAELIAFWKGLPDEVRRTAESDFSLILDMMDELGIQSIQSTAQQAGCDASLLKAWDGKTLEEKTLIAFLDFKDLWDNASAIAFADNVPARYWQRRKNLPSNLMDDSEEACDDFAKKLGEFLHSKQGRGKQCKVERYQAEDGRLFLFALFEDFARSSLEWEEDDLQAYRRRQALQYIFQYSPKDGMLSIYCPNATSFVEDLQLLFAESILHIDELSEDIQDIRIYELRPLLNTEFRFHWKPEWGIEDAQLIKLRLTRRFSKQRVIFEAGRGNGSEEVYELLDAWGEAENLDDFFVTQAEVRVRYQVDTGKVRSCSFTVTWPNYCSLKPDTLGKHLQEMLVMSGIELKEPEDDGEASQEAVASA